MNEDVFRRLLDRIELLERTLLRTQTRMNNMFREGHVKSVDVENGLAIVDAMGVESKPSPWVQQAGSINDWTPLSENQRVMLVSPGGDMGRSFIMPGGWTDEVKQPHNKAGETRRTIGKYSITESGGGLVIEVDGTKFEFTGAGFKQTGGKQEHDGKNVGSTHTHGGILVGGQSTKEPNP